MTLGKVFMLSESPRPLWSCPWGFAKMKTPQIVRHSHAAPRGWAAEICTSSRETKRWGWGDLFVEQEGLSSQGRWSKPHRRL